MFERFTKRTRSVLVLAQEEARLLHHGHIGTEHILLGLIHEREGVGGKVLTSFGITLDGMRHQVRTMLGEPGESGGPGEFGDWGERAEGVPPADPAPPFTPRAKKVLELSLREALQLGHNNIGTEHILLGIIAEGEGGAAQALTGFGVDLAAARQRVISFISGTSGHPHEAQASDQVGTTDTSPFVRVQRTSAEPQCPECRAELSEGARFRTILVQPDAESDDKIPLRTYVVYCARCGTSLHLFTPDT